MRRCSFRYGIYRSSLSRGTFPPPRCLASMWIDFLPRRPDSPFALGLMSVVRAVAFAAPAVRSVLWAGSKPPGQGSVLLAHVSEQAVQALAWPLAGLSAPVEPGCLLVSASALQGCWADLAADLWQLVHPSHPGGRVLPSRQSPAWAHSSGAGLGAPLGKRAERMARPLSGRYVPKPSRLHPK